jgi:hypothetical protein
LNPILLLVVVGGVCFGACIWHSPDAALRLGQVLKARAVALRQARALYARVFLEEIEAQRLDDGNTNTNLSLQNGKACILSGSD